MIRPEMIYWKKDKSWYRKVSNSYRYELTDSAPEEARESYALYKSGVDQALQLVGATPYDGVIVHL